MPVDIKLKRRLGRGFPRIPKSRRIDVSRGEFNHVIDLLNERRKALLQDREDLNHVLRELDIQFKRIAQLQFEVDELKKRR
jgi:hypothetical protein